MLDLRLIFSKTYSLCPGKRPLTLSAQNIISPLSLYAGNQRYDRYKPRISLIYDNRDVVLAFLLLGQKL